MESKQPADASNPLATFSYQAGPRSGEEIPVRSPIVTVGQGPQNDIVLDDDTVSTRHARLEFSDGGWRVTDLDSSNGTRVEGVGLAPGVPTPLAAGSAVEFGGVRLEFRSREEEELQRARAEYSAPPTSPAGGRHSGFRLPLWVLALIVGLVALLVALFLWLGGPPETAAPPVDAVSTVVLEDSVRLAA